MNEKIKLTRFNGTTVDADLICFLEDTTSGKRYIYYTLNEIVGSGPSSTVKIYVAKMKQNDASLDVQISDNEWNSLKGYMGEVLKGTVNPALKYLPISEISDFNIVSEKVIAMPTSYDYVNKHRGVYAEAVGTAGEQITPAPIANPLPEPTPVIEPAPSAPVENPVPIAPEMPPIAEPQPAEVKTEPSTPEIVPVEPIPVVPVVPEPVNTPIENTVPIAPEVPPVVETPQPETPSTVTPADVELKPIDIGEIERKYSEMLETLNKLKNQEIEAAKRYNATIELSAMHNEQHASYVANEQNKEIIPGPIEPIPSAVEPAPITPEVPTAPAPSTGDIETNWFDMPAA